MIRGTNHRPGVTGSASHRVGAARVSDGLEGRGGGRLRGVDVDLVDSARDEDTTLSARLEPKMPGILEAYEGVCGIEIGMANFDADDGMGQGRDASSPLGLGPLLGVLRFAVAAVGAVFALCDGSGSTRNRLGERRALGCAHDAQLGLRELLLELLDVSEHLLEGELFLLGIEALGFRDKDASARELK